MPELNIAAVGDLHCTRGAHGKLMPAFSVSAGGPTCCSWCGDLTDGGLADEARVLVGELQGLTIPKLAVLGNHDYESGPSRPTSVRSSLTAGWAVLDGDRAVDPVRGRVVGVKGFAGGFGRRMLEPLGRSRR